MSITTLAFQLIAGVILCFFGYRFLRLAMSAAGFVLGAYLGYFVYGLVSESLPSPENGLWGLVFMGAGGILLAALSFRIYKAALFYITMFTTAFLVLKTYLMFTGWGVGVMTFFMIVLGKTSIGKEAGALNNLSIPGNGTTGAAVAAAMSKLPGSTPIEKIWIAIGAALIIGAIAGTIVLILQKPAIIVATALFGAVLLASAVFTIFANLGTFDFSAASLVTAFSGGQTTPALSTAVTLGFTVLGLLLQFKTAKKAG